MSVRDQLITGTADLIRRHGVAGTGITEIIQSTGVARRSVYLNFPGGKAELVAEATRHAGDAITDRIAELVEDPTANLVVAFAEAYKELLRQADFEGGCVVAAVVAGRRDAPEAAEIAATTFRRWEALLAQRFRIDGRAQHQAEVLATTTVAAIEGAIMMSRAHRSTEPLDRVVEHLKALIDTQR